MGQIVTTATALSGGVRAVAGVAMVYRIELTGTWATDEIISLLFTARQTAASELAGYGNATGSAPVFLLTYQRKLYFLAGTVLYFSALDNPEMFNRLNQPGNSFIEMSNQYGFADDLLALAIFRRAMAVLGRRHIQIWNVDPDPAQNRQVQTLENEGTVNGASVRGIGTLDVLYAADSGVRSLAARVNSEDAVVNDLGRPVDALIQAAMRSVGTSGMCSIVEPQTNRYWLAIGTTIYVLSYFPSSDIVGWSTYDASVPVTPVSPTYTVVGSGVYKAEWSGLVVGKTYKFERGAAEEKSSAPSPFASGSTNVFDSNVTFVADTTTAQVELTAAANPGSVTCLLSELFTPEKFEVFNGQIFVRATTGNIYRYGGSDNATYDSSKCSWETPWLDARSAGTEKPSRGVDAAMDGAWRLKLGTDSSSNNPLKQVLQNTGSTFKLGSVSTQMEGTHFKLRGESTGSGYARIGMVVYHFEKGNQR